MNFQNVNDLIMTFNLYSGNLFPMSDDSSQFSNGWKIYSVFICLLEIVYMILTYSGLFFVPMMKSLQDGTINAMVSLEVLILSIYVNCRRKFLKKIIKLFNRVLNDADQVKIHNCFERIIYPRNKALRIFSMSALSSVGVWLVSPILKVMEKDEFSYIDFQVPLYLPGNPFRRTTFILGVLFETVCGLYFIIKKTSIDAYVIHTLTVLTAQYHYLSKQLEDIFVENRRDAMLEKELTQSSAQKDLRNLIRQHSTVTQVGQMLKSFLALNVAITYCNSIFRFCFVGFMMITAPPSAYTEKCLILMYGFGAFIQVCMICFCVQELLEASSSVTDNAFYRQWYDSDSWSRHTYAKMTISKNLECRISAFGTVDLSLKSFMTIVKQSYSACMFFLKANT